MTGSGLQRAPQPLQEGAPVSEEFLELPTALESEEAIHVPQYDRSHLPESPHGSATASTKQPPLAQALGLDRLRAGKHVHYDGFDSIR